MTPTRFLSWRSWEANLRRHITLLTIDSTKRIESGLQDQGYSAWPKHPSRDFKTRNCGFGLRCPIGIEMASLLTRIVEMFLPTLPLLSSLEGIPTTLTPFTLLFKPSVSPRNTSSRYVHISSLRFSITIVLYMMTFHKHLTTVGIATS